MTKVLLVGVFDLFHYGHLRLIKRAAKLGDYCIVAVQTDEYVARFKPPGAQELYYSTEVRMEMIRALRCVDEVITYNSVGEDIMNIGFDVFAKGPDQTHAGFASAVKWCEENGKEVVIIPRTEGISTSQIKEDVPDKSQREVSQ